MESVALEAVTSIGTSAFSGCTALESVALEAVTSIGESAFRGCTALTGDFNLPNLTGTLLPNAFKNTKITSFYAPNLTAVNSYAFEGCTALESVALEAVTSIGSYAFSGCTALESVVVKATTPPSIQSNAFAFSSIASGTGTIYVPDDSVTAYQEATNWVTYADRIKGISELETDNPDLYEEIKDYLS